MEHHNRTADIERWNANYSQSDYVFGTEPNAFLAAHKNLLPTAGRALAVADGEGRNGVWLAEQGLDVLSIDFSPVAQAKAQALAADRGVKLTTELADVLEWEWPTDEFDVIAVIFTQFASPPDRIRMFSGVKQALKPGGLLLLIGYSPKQIGYGTGGPSNVDNLYTRSILEEAFGGFSELEINEHDAVMNEGSRHSGLSALIHLVGRK